MGAMALAVAAVVMSFSRRLELLFGGGYETD